MSATQKVSVTRQIIYTLIPFGAFYAAHNINKLKWFAGIALAVTIMMTVPEGVALDMAYSTYDLEKYQPLTKSWDLTQEGEMFVIVSLIKILFGYAISLYLVITWTKKWNLQFGKSE